MIKKYYKPVQGSPAYDLLWYLKILVPKDTVAIRQFNKKGSEDGNRRS